LITSLLSAFLLKLNNIHNIYGIQEVGGSISLTEDLKSNCTDLVKELQGENSLIYENGSFME